MNIIQAEIAATADAIRDADKLIFDIDPTLGMVVRLEPKPIFTTCLSYYNEGPCPCCTD